MHVDNQLVNGRLISWDWDGTSFNITVKGEPIEVEVGRNVPSNAKVSVVNIPHP